MLYRLDSIQYRILKQLDLNMSRAEHNSNRKKKMTTNEKEKKKQKKTLLFALCLFHVRAISISVHHDAMSLQCMYNVGTLPRQKKK